jgi:two-component system, OmpR family, alkaline phosphatase synthesis response regulator PhoP
MSFSSSQTQTQTILVIEDERVTRTSLLSFLRDEGFRAIGAENGLVGVQLAHEHLPDLIICDIMMPELDGYDVLTTLQQNSATAKIPFIFLTMSATAEGAQQSLAMGADDYLAKPVSSDQLRRAIAAQLDQQGGTPSGLGTLPSFNHRADLRGDARISPVFAETDPLGGLSPTFLEQTLPILSQPADLPESELKDLLFERFCQVLLQRLSALRTQIEHLQDSDLPVSNRQALTQQLHLEFIQLLSLTNEIAALRNIITPANAATLLDSFSWDQPSKP